MSIRVFSFFTHKFTFAILAFDVALVWTLRLLASLALSQLDFIKVVLEGEPDFIYVGIPLILSILFASLNLLMLLLEGTYSRSRQLKFLTIFALFNYFRPIITQLRQRAQINGWSPGWSNLNQGINLQSLAGFLVELVALHPETSSWHLESVHPVVYDGDCHIHLWQEWWILLHWLNTLVTINEW